MRRGPEGDPDPHDALPRDGLSQEQVCNVEAGQEQQRRDSRHEQHQRPRRGALLQAPQTVEIDRPVAIIGNRAAQ